ncbi:MAG: hypothetical protein JWO08_1205 [Verrucomicrobiaceae bacterium]|nr:hypothetical protein [Verrucomicrobiaceae bacterium]
MHSRPYLISTLLCGGLPLAVGSFIYFTWLATRWDYWPMLGIITILAGLVLFVIGVYYLSRYICHAKRQDHVPPAKIVANSLGAVVLLLANFPVAYHYMASAMEISMHFNVTLENRSGEPVTDFRIGGSLQEEVLIPLVKTGETITRRLSVVHRQSIDCSAFMADAKPIAGAYPDSWRHRGYLITIEKGGTITVVPNDGLKDSAPSGLKQPEAP